MARHDSEVDYVRGSNTRDYAGEPVPERHPLGRLVWYALMDGSSPDAVAPYYDSSVWKLGVIVGWEASSSFHDGEYTYTVRDLVTNSRYLRVRHIHHVVY